MAILQGMSLPTQHPTSDLPTLDEKSVFVDTPCDEKEAALDSDLDKSSSALEDTVDENAQYVNGEPVITSGRDVSRYLVDLRDDEDPPLTFRSAVLGTVIGGLGAALFQVRPFLAVFSMHMFRHWLVDLYFQTGSNRNLDGVSTPRNLLTGNFMVDLSSEAFSG